MAFRLNGFVIRGEIRNGKKNSVSGWLEVIPENEVPPNSRFGRPRIMLSLTGNLQGELDGRTFRFEVRDEDFEGLQPIGDNRIAWEQIGTMGDSAFRSKDSSLDVTDDDTQASDESSAEDDRSSLYLEWFSQNGRVVLELSDPTLEFAESYLQLADPVADDMCEADIDSYPGFPSIVISDSSEQDDSGEQNESAEPRNLEETGNDDDPFSLFPSDLDEQIRLSAYEEESDDENSFAEDETADESESDGSVVRDDGEGDPYGNSQFIVPEDYPRTLRSWDEVIPGIDPATKAMYEQWDEVIYGTRDEPLTWLFEEPLSLPKPDDVRDEEHAWQVLSSLLAAMALRGVAFDMCPHFTAMQGYRLLIEELLPEASIHPNLVATGFIQHYSSHESCDECQAEMDEEYRQHNPDN
jgi:hypothetical protein